MTEEERMKQIQDIIKEQRKYPLVFLSNVPGHRAILPDEKIGPKFKPVNPAKKITKETVTVEGDRGSVDRSNPDVIGPNMSQVIKDVAPLKPTRDFTATEMAQNLMSPGYNKMKKGGVVKAKSKVSSASKRADGIATKGKTRGRMI